MIRVLLCTILLFVNESLCRTLKYCIIGLILFSFGSQAIADISDNLIAYWNFDESQGSQVYDSSGLGNSGTIIGATRTSGILGNGLDFDGMNDYVEIANKPAQQITTNQLSISLWFNLQQDIGNTQSRFICKQEYNNPENAWGLELFGKDYWNSAGNQLVFHDTTGTEAYICLSGKLIETGAWHHVGAVDNAGVISFYFDGQLIYTSPKGYGIPQNIPSAIMIGRTCDNPWGVTFYFNGLMDEVRLYNRALTSSEMYDLYLIPEPATVLLLGLGFFSLTGKKKP